MCVWNSRIWNFEFRKKLLPLRNVWKFAPCKRLRPVMRECRTPSICPLMRRGKIVWRTSKNAKMCPKVANEFKTSFYGPCLHSAPFRLTGLRVPLVYYCFDILDGRVFAWCSISFSIALVPDIFVTRHACGRVFLMFSEPAVGWIRWTYI
jgi:hypothetical protein